jgi:hypothetical protein
MKCPHCLVEVNPNFREFHLNEDSEGFWSIYIMLCPNPDCRKFIIDLANGTAVGSHPGSGAIQLAGITKRYTIKPFSSSRPPVPSEVENLFAEDYNEACLILIFSPKASAALSRRCLQNILREKAHVKKSDLSNEIQEVIDSGKLPTHLSESIDAIRNIGNFATHPIKSKSSGEIVPVEMGEAEWLLDVLESLFDYYFVQPSLIKSKRDALNKKLLDSGKPTMK